MDAHLSWFVDVALALFGAMQKSMDPATAKLFAAVSAPADSDPAGRSAKKKALAATEICNRKVEREQRKLELDTPEKRQAAPPAALEELNYASPDDADG
eukprot:2079320-Rhodomonas_salina.1